MTTLKKQFLVNKTESILVLNKGYLEIPRGSYKPVTANDLAESTVEYALGRNWAVVVDEEPKHLANRPSDITLTIVKPNTGLTIEELRAEQAKKEEKEIGTTTELGVKTLPVEATSTTIGVPEEITAVVDADPAPAKTKKSKAA